jgi:hypothetical protein
MDALSSYDKRVSVDDSELPDLTPERRCAFAQALFV